VFDVICSTHVHGFQVSHLGTWRPFSLVQRYGGVTSSSTGNSIRNCRQVPSSSATPQIWRILDNIAETANTTNMAKIAGTRKLKTAAVGVGVWRKYGVGVRVQMQLCYFQYGISCNLPKPASQIQYHACQHWYHEIDTGVQQ